VCLTDLAKRGDLKHAMPFLVLPCMFSLGRSGEKGRCETCHTTVFPVMCVFHMCWKGRFEICNTMPCPALPCVFSISGERGDLNMSCMFFRSPCYPSHTLLSLSPSLYSIVCFILYSEH
jgi:hypothetical protein